MHQIIRALVSDATLTISYNSSRKYSIFEMFSGFSLTMGVERQSIVVYITLDLDRPRRGFINLSGSHDAMLELRKNFQ